MSEQIGRANAPPDLKTKPQIHSQDVARWPHPGNRPFIWPHPGSRTIWPHPGSRPLPHFVSSVYPIDFVIYSLNLAISLLILKLTEQIQINPNLTNFYLVSSTPICFDLLISSVPILDFELNSFKSEFKRAFGFVLSPSPLNRAYTYLNLSLIHI